MKHLRAPQISIYVILLFSLLACKEVSVPEIDRLWQADKHLFLFATDPAMADFDSTAATAKQAKLHQSFDANNNVVDNPGIELPGFAVGNYGINAKPSYTDLGEMADLPSGTFFSTVDYKGALDKSNDWTAGWSLVGGHTIYSDSVYINQVADKPVDTVSIIGNETEIKWTAGTVYLIDSVLVVKAGQTLQIEAGTLVKAVSGKGSNTSAILVQPGGKLVAIGTADKPIIFTTADDTLAQHEIEPQAWGGIILLGNAPVATGTANFTSNSKFEGPINGAYGGQVTDDNSGALAYVSIRYAGAMLGSTQDQGALTLCGVGSGTKINHVECYAGASDALHIEGGTAGIQYLIAAFPTDDCIDFDNGFRGKGQFWLAMQATDRGDRIGEHDGVAENGNRAAYSYPLIYNATYIGRGQAGNRRLITFRDNSGGVYANSIFMAQTKGIDIEYWPWEAGSSYERFEAGELIIKNCVFHRVAGYSGEIPPVPEFK